MEKLALESPVLVDLFYAHSLEQPADTAEIDKLLLELDNVGSDFSPYQQAIAAMNLNLYQRHYMAKKLCEKFAEQGVYASFELSQFIDFQDYDPANCLTKIIAFSGQITTDFFQPSFNISK